MAIGCTQSAYGWWPRNSDEVTIGYNKIYQMANSQFARAYSLTTEYKHKLPVWLEYWPREHFKGEIYCGCKMTMDRKSPLTFLAVI